MRDCETCIYKRPSGACSHWDCEYINFEDAANAYKAIMYGKEYKKRMKGEKGGRPYKQTGGD